jgi:hypothetical protein
VGLLKRCLQSLAAFKISSTSKSSSSGIVSGVLDSEIVLEDADEDGIELVLEKESLALRHLHKQRNKNMLHQLNLSLKIYRQSIIALLHHKCHQNFAVSSLGKPPFYSWLLVQLSIFFLI